jgi:NitT/TauT family transport system substrate-binding protein
MFLRWLCAAGIIVLLSFNPDLAHAELLRVRVGVIPVIGASPLFVADNEGWLKKAGLDLAIKVFQSGPNLVQAAASGDIDLYVAGVAPAAVGRSKNIDLRVVTATAVDENVLVADAALKSFFKPGVTTSAAFKAFHQATGEPVKIATQPPSSVPQTNLQYWLREVAKVDASDVRIIAVGIDATQQALLAKAVDAATVREPTLTIIEERDPTISILAKGGELFPGQPGTVVAVYGPFADSHPQAVQAIVNGIVEAVVELQKDPDRAAPAVDAALSKNIIPAATIRKSLTSPAVRFVADPKSIESATKAFLAYQVKLGVLKTAPSLTGLFDDHYYAKAVAP